ncbi:hypothetical protein BOTBODRAFT_116094 [Botryobasidium botryosum FD-172 SS1]|uniref:Uncharacterized protein n=1 Tax=Botryobasidium botryosum (strain FD-172 SS1) TaxID=930990 RepID=A0A067M3T3_BOTB1|nr:hypothetical protein BOTBODRAFT_116094 [Botryobasidium botryosum FD-172 SS1]
MTAKTKGYDLQCNLGLTLHLRLLQRHIQIDSGSAVAEAAAASAAAARAAATAAAHQLTDLDDDDTGEYNGDQTAAPPNASSGPLPQSVMDEHNFTNAFIRALEQASLDEEGLPEDILHRLRFPEAPEAIVDEDVLLSLRLYLSLHNASEQAYKDVREAILLRHPDHAILTWHQVKAKIAEITGVVSLARDMCIKSCMAYVSVWASLEECPYCHEPRYDLEVLKASKGKIKRARQEFHTVLLGPQLQAQRSTVEGAQDIRYRAQTTEKVFADLATNPKIPVYKDLIYGSAYLKAVQTGVIRAHDSVLVLSVDGAQLYRDKKSDCWIYIYLVVDYGPDLRYKKLRILPGGTIPGPNKPRNLDSFLFVGLHHLAALQREGLRVWDAIERDVVDNNPYLLLGTADGPGLACLNGFVSHHGAFGCRVNCPVKGRHKAGGSHYYAAHLKPDDYHVAGCTHEDIDVGAPLPPMSPEQYTNGLSAVLSARNATHYEELRKATGIVKPTLFSGLSRKTAIPYCFPIDIMHALGLNLPELFLLLWRGTMDCFWPDDRSTWDWAIFMNEARWKAHGKIVADARPYLPGSFDRPPRNPAEKINSQYKSTEYQTYLYGLGPGVFYRVLPDEYWAHFCKLVRYARLMYQHEISRDQVREGRELSVVFVREFETLYYQRKATRIHFCRQSIHNVLHLPPSVARVGPAPLASQYPMERTIGNLGQEIKQPSNPYANLSQRTVVRCQVNALKAMIPSLNDDKPKLPLTAIGLGGGYNLLHARDEYRRTIGGPEGLAICAHLQSQGESNTVARLIRWARLQLPNGQIARSAWKETLKPLEQVRMSRNVKLSLNGQTAFAEVHFYFRGTAPGAPTAFALVTPYSTPDPLLLEQSSNTLYACTHTETLRVVNVKSIQAVVAMVPASNIPLIAGQTTYFVVEKLGLEVQQMGGAADEVDEDAPDEVADGA